MSLNPRTTGAKVRGFWWTLHGFFLNAGWMPAEAAL